MSTNPRGIPAGNHRVLLADVAGYARRLRAERANALLSHPNRILPVLVGLLSMVAATGVNAAAPNSSPPISLHGNSAIDNAAPALVFGPEANVVFAPSSIKVGDSSQMTIKLTNLNQTGDIVGVHVVDTYPTGIANVPGGSVISDTCSFSEDVSTAGSANLSNGTIPAANFCSIVIEVVGTSPGAADNYTGVITSTNAPDGSGASAILTVGLPAPNADVSFDPASIYVLGTSRMTIKLTNPNPTDAITGARFTDVYPTPLKIANAADDTNPSNTCGGNIDAVSGGSSVALTGGTIPANGSCSVVINVVGTSAGSTVNHTGAIDSDNALSGADASGLLNITNSTLVVAPSVTKTFMPATVAPGGTSQMTIAFHNPNAEAIFGVQVNDVYPMGMVNVDAIGNPVVSDTCNFIQDVPRGGGWAKLSDGTIPLSGCSIVIDVVADVMGSTTLTNTTGAVASGNAVSGASATGVLTVDTGAPTVTCVLPSQVDIVGDFVSIDLASLFMPAPGSTLTYSANNPPLGLSIGGSLLTGTLATAGTFTSTLIATTTGPGGLSASEDVMFVVLPLDELVFRDGFGDSVPQCQ
jgi:hypothetical protein